MSKTQKYILKLIENLGCVTEEDITDRGIPLTALHALVIKGFVYKPERYGTAYRLTSAA